MSTLAEIEKAVELLPIAEKEMLLAHLTAQFGRAAATSPLPTRQSGLHAGAWKDDADFDAVLPDEFWIGREA